MLDLPADWEDRSSLLFVAPEAPEVPTKQRIEASREALHVDFAFDHRSPKTILEGRAEALREVDPTFEIVASEPFTCELGDGWCLDQRVTIADVTVRQLAVVVTVGPIIVSATAAAGEDRFPFMRPKLEKVLRSMRARR